MKQKGKVTTEDMGLKQDSDMASALLLYNKVINLSSDARKLKSETRREQKSLQNKMESELNRIRRESERNKTAIIALVGQKRFGVLTKKYSLCIAKSKKQSQQVVLEDDTVLGGEPSEGLDVEETKGDI